MSWLLARGSLWERCGDTWLPAWLTSVIDLLLSSSSLLDILPFIGPTPPEAHSGRATAEVFLSGYRDRRQEYGTRNVARLASSFLGHHPVTSSTGNATALQHHTPLSLLSFAQDPFFSSNLDPIRTRARQLSLEFGQRHRSFTNLHLKSVSSLSLTQARYCSPCPTFPSPKRGVSWWIPPAPQ